MGDACTLELIRRCLLPDFCSYCVSGNASVNVVEDGSTLTAHQQLSGLSDTKQVKYRNALLSH